jgi:elongation of very long chain fatty acids protein 6
MWGMLFTISKLVELIDTYFIVLRKQKLIFLHWYHHITVLTYTWYYYGPGGTPFSHQLFMMMNYFVHSIMYMYYAVRASGIYRPPKWVNLFITSLQLVQMVCGTAGMLYILTGMLYTPDFYCDGVTETSYGYPGWALAMYGSYFILFLYFFYNSYIKKDSTRDRPASNGINDRRKTHQPRGTSGSPSLHVNGVNNNNNNNNSPLDKDKSE